MKVLRIGVADAFSQNEVLNATDEPEGAEVVTIGLDFGTAFTKAAVRFRQRDYAVRWDEAALVSDPYLMPSCFSEHQSGTTLLGTKLSIGWTRFQGLKMALLQARSLEHASPAEIENAVIFVALAIRHIQGWFRAMVPNAHRAAVRWRVHAGLPSTGTEDALAQMFRVVASMGLALASGSGPVNRARVATIAKEPGRGVEVIPELLAQLDVYFGSNQRQDDLHALIDVGAGTLDVGFFILHKREEEVVMTLAGCAVEELGAHFLLAAGVGKLGQAMEWSDEDAGLAPHVLSAKTHEPAEAIRLRQLRYSQEVKATFNAAYLQAREHYTAGPVNLGHAPLRVFFCGGGSRLGPLQPIPGELDRHFRQLGRTQSFLIAPLPRPDYESFVYDGSDYDRMSVAHGLCKRGVNIGTLIGPSGLDRAALGVTEYTDRDADV